MVTFTHTAAKGDLLLGAWPETLTYRKEQHNIGLLYATDLGVFRYTELDKQNRHLNDTGNK